MQILLKKKKYPESIKLQILKAIKNARIANGKLIGG